ncbi:MAG: stress-responsive transcription factor hsf1 [Vezdaea aestivalis]|nr:MAG: stress-responsive transcription factor hsf1 [Vezdaea aestivalis]
MSMIRTRNRPAPDSDTHPPPPPPQSQAQQQPTDQQQFPSDLSQMSDQQFIDWGLINSNTGNNSLYANNIPNPPNGYTPANQIARRAQNSNAASNRAPAYEFDDDPNKWADLSNGTDPTAEDSLDWLNDEVESERRAQVAKREQQSRRKQIPPFIQKLSSFLDDGKNTDLIRWSDSGNSFVVLDEDEFAKTLIPELFKHNNYASFVRQLNMYGFHKKVGLSDNSMRNSERKNKSPSEYSNSYFKRGRPNLLWLINKPRTQPTRRKAQARGDDNDRASDDDAYNDDPLEFNPAPNPSTGPRKLIAQGEKTAPLKKHEMGALQVQLAEIRKQQSFISQAINRLSIDQNSLAAQAQAFQDRHDRQENSIQAILTFLATVYHRSLEGQDGANLVNMFSNALGRPSQSQGSVMEASDFAENPQTSTSSPRPFQRKPPLLLPAASRASTLSPASASSPQTRRSPNPSSRTIEELPDSTSPQLPNNLDFSSPAPSPAVTSTSSYPTDNSIINMINRTNRSVLTTPQNAVFDFPAALEHSQTANGQSPLTDQQRSDMLRLMSSNTAGSSSSAPASNNALISPPAPSPSPTHLQGTTAELEMLHRLQAETERRVADLASMVTPLSPTGSIPGIGNDGQYFDGGSGSQSGGLDFDALMRTDLFDDDSYAYGVGTGQAGATQDGALQGFEDLYDPGLEVEGLEGREGLDLQGRARVKDEGGSARSGTHTPQRR